MKLIRFVGAGAALAVALAPIAMANTAQAAPTRGHRATATCVKGKKVTNRAKCRAGEVSLKLNRGAIGKVAQANGTLVLCYARNGKVAVVRGAANACKKHRMTYLSLASLGVASPTQPAPAQPAPPSLGPTAAPDLQRSTAYDYTYTPEASSHVAFEVRNYDPAHVTYQVTATAGTPSAVATCTTGRHAGVGGCGSVSGLLPETTVTVTVVATANGIASTPSHLDLYTQGIPPGAPTITGAPTWVAGTPGSGATHALSVPYTDGAPGSSPTTGHNWTLYRFANGSWDPRDSGTCLNSDGTYPNTSSPCIVNLDGWDYTSDGTYAVTLMSSSDESGLSSPESNQMEAAAVAP